MRAVFAAPAAALAVLAVLWNAGMCQHNDGKLPATAPALPDVGHSLLPDLSASSGLLTNAPFVAALAALVLTGAWREPGLFESWLLLALARPFFFGSTTLPEIKNACNVTFLQRLVNGGCNDKIYSGHVCNMLTILTFLVRGGHVGLAFAIASAVLYSLLVIATRGHYSVDVLVAWLAVALVLSHTDTIVRFTAWTR